MLAAGTLSGLNLSDVGIPDNGGFADKAVSSIVLVGAPTNAIVTGVEVEYRIDHAWIGNLRVYLTTQRNGAWHDHLYLWNREGGGDDAIHETETGLPTWNGLHPNGTWYLVVGDFASGGLGAIDEWRLSVDWFAPSAPLPPIVAGRLVWHSYSDYVALDGQIHVYDFDSGSPYQLATTTISTAVVHAHNPILSEDGRFMTFMGLPAGQTYGADWRQHLDAFVYDFVTDRVRNVSVDLGLDGYGSLEEDPALSPDSRTIVFKRNVAEIWAVDLYDLTLRQVTTESGEKSGPRYSPDGESIVFWVNVGASAYLASAPAHAANPMAPAVVLDNPGIQDYFPSFWDANRVLYASWRNGVERDDEVKIWNASAQTDQFAAFNSPTAEDSDPFGVSSSLVGFSTTRGSGKWDLWYGDPLTGSAAALDFGIIGKHNLGGRYTPNRMDFVPPSADFDDDGDVDGGDFLAWQRGFGVAAPNAVQSDGDADHDRDVDADDLQTWAATFGADPAPLTASRTASGAAATATHSSTPAETLSRKRLTADLADAALAQVVARRQDAQRPSAKQTAIMESLFFAAFDSGSHSTSLARQRFVDADADPLELNGPRSVTRASDASELRIEAGGIAGEQPSPWQ